MGSGSTCSEGNPAKGTTQPALTSALKVTSVRSNRRSGRARLTYKEHSPTQRLTVRGERGEGEEKNIEGFIFSPVEVFLFFSPAAGVWLVVWDYGVSSWLTVRQRGRSGRPMDGFTEGMCSSGARSSYTNSMGSPNEFRARSWG